VDNQNRQPTSFSQSDKPQAAALPTSTDGTLDGRNLPKADSANIDAQSILTMNNLQASHGIQTKLPKKLVIVIVGLILFAILASFLVSSIKPGTDTQSPETNSSFGLPNQSNVTTGSGTTNQINQDVKSCSNPVNAVTVC
jgi:hypothetical protein